MGEARDELERRLRYRYSRHPEWDDLAGGSNLFDSLKATVTQGEEVRALELVEGWRPFVEEAEGTTDKREADEVGERWERMKALAWCAEQAIAHPECFGDEVGLTRLALDWRPPGSAPNRVQCDLSWAWLCVRSLLGHEQRIGRTVEVAAAGWDNGKGDGGGFLVTLVLEVLKGGAGDAAHCPQDTLITIVDPDFAKSVADAWTAARAAVEAAGTELPPMTGRWRILRGGEPAQEATGRSASGAAARGWWFALKDLVPDEGIVVLAEAGAGENDEVTWKGVDGVAAKVRAIAAEQIYDTILVADEGHRLAAERTLTELDATDRVLVRSIT